LAQARLELRQLFGSEVGERFLKRANALAGGFNFLADTIDDGRLVFGARNGLRVGAVAVGHAFGFTNDALFAAGGLVDPVPLTHGVGEQFAGRHDGQANAG